MMSLPLVMLALLPAVALVGPLLVGVAFDADWVLKAGLGFDLLAVVLGGGACLVVRLPGAAASGRLGTSMATAVGGGLVVFGLVFAAVAIWRLSTGTDD